MSTPLVDCPSDDLLTRYLDDALSPTVSGPLTLHIDECPTCQAKLDTIIGEGQVSDRLRVLSSVILRGPSPESTFDHGIVATTANDTQMLGRDGIPMVPRVHVTRPSVPGYEVEGEIGRGGMGVVFKAQHKRLNRTVALKMVLAAGVADPRVTQRFLFEAEVLARVQHPQVVQVYEVNMFTAPTGVVFPYLAMELLSGGTLLQWAVGRSIVPNEAAELIEGLARAVHAVHQQGIVHRDLKPANILRSVDGVFKVTDFGLAKLTSSSGAQLTGTGMVVGTPAYMAPEQAGGEGPIGPPADVYSLGAMLFELLAGRPPFPGDDAMSVLLKVIRDPAPDVRAFRPDVPRDLAAVVMKCLSKEPARRYQSADDFADDLRRFLNRRPTRARTLSAVERVWYWARRNPAVATLVCSLAAVLTVGFVSTFILWQRAELEADRARQALGREEKLRIGAEKQRQEADELRQEAEDRRREADTSRREADKSRAYLKFDQAANRCEDGYVTEGLSEFVAALELAGRLEDEPLQRVIRANIAAWQRELYSTARTFPPPPGPIGAADFSRNGEWLLTGDNDYRVRVWDADTAKLLFVLDAASWLEEAGRIGGVKPTFHGVAVDPDRKWVAACTGHEFLIVWSLADKKVRYRHHITSPAGRTPSLWRVAFAGGKLWLGGDDGLLFGYDPATGKHVTSLNLPGSSHPQAMSAVGGGPLMVSLVSPPEHLSPSGPQSTDVRVVRRPKATSITTMRPSPDGTGLFTGDRSGRVIEWDLTTGQPVDTYQFHPNSWVRGLAVSADGRYVAGSATDGSARLWRRGAVYNPLMVTDLDGAYGSGVALSADGGQMTVGNEDGRVVTYDTRTRVPLGAALRRMQPWSLAVRPKTGELLVGDADGLRLARPAEPAYVPVPFGPPGVTPRGMVRFLDYRPDGRALLVGCGRVNVFDPATGRLLAGPHGYEEPLGGRYSADGKRIVYGARNGWGLLNGDDCRELLYTPLDSGYVSVFPSRPTDAITFFCKEYAVTHAAADGKMVVSRWLNNLAGVSNRLITNSVDETEWRIANRDKVELMRTDDLLPARPPIKAGGTVTGLTQTLDGKTLAVLVTDESVQLWDVATAKPLLARPVPVWHSRAVTGLALNPDATVLVTGSRDRTLQFWDVQTGLVLGPRRTHDSPVTTVAYSPTGKEVAVGTSDGTTVVWQAPRPPDDTPLPELQKRYPAGNDELPVHNR